MGMPVSSEYLQELISRAFGDFMQEGFLVTIADALLIGANSIAELLHNWSRVLHRIQENNLTLSAPKTEICPKRTVVLGWSWCGGTLSPNVHKLSPLAAATPPKTCTAMKSFIGAYKALSRCIPRYASLLSPLEDSIKGLEKTQVIQWTDELNDHFGKAQQALKSPSVLTIPKPSDKLVLTVDASPLNKGLGATLFVNREGDQLPAGFYSFKMKDHQQGWYPCEHEALAIASGVHHFAPYARESTDPMLVLTDSKPCAELTIVCVKVNSQLPQEYPPSCPF